MDQPKFYQPLDVATSTLALAHSIGAPSLVVATGDAAKFGSPTPINPIRVTVQGAAGRCHYRVVGRVGSVLQVDGTIDGYEDLAFAKGAKVGVLISGSTISEIHEAITDTVEAINGLAPVATSGSYPDLTDKPDLFSGDYNDLTDKPVLAPVATSGSYPDLTNKPNLFSGSYPDLTNKPNLSPVAISGAYPDLTGRPVLAPVATSGSYPDLVNKPVLATVATSGSYPDLTNRPNLAPVATAGTYDSLTNKPTIVNTVAGRSGIVVLSTADVSGLAPVALSNAYSDLSGKPAPVVPGGSAGQIQYRDASGSFAGSSALSTTSNNPLTINFNNSDYFVPNGQGAHIDLQNSNANGQSVIAASFVGQLATKIRSDYVGNLTYVCTRPGGGHTFYVGGDFGSGGIAPLAISSAGNVTVYARANTSFIVRGAVGQANDLEQYQAITGTVLSSVDKLGADHPPQLADSTALNGSIYYSTTQAKLCFKDYNGVVNPLH